MIRYMTAMINKSFLFLILLGFLTSTSYGQYSYKDLDEFQKYREALELYNKNAFSQVIPVIDEFLTINDRLYESDFRNIYVHSYLIRAKSAFYINDKDAGA